MPQPDDQPAAATAGSSPFAEQLCVPQFGILHILILTAVTAVLLKLQLVLMDEQLRPRWQGIQVAYMILLACGVIGSGVLIRLKCYAMLDRLQPGHWFVLVFTLQGILALAGWAFLRCVNFDSGISPSRQWAYFIPWLLTNFLEAAAYAYATRKVQDAWRWKILLGFFTVCTGMSAVSHVFFIFARLHLPYGLIGLLHWFSCFCCGGWWLSSSCSRLS